jgi:Sulfotransferase family
MTSDGAWPNLFVVGAQKAGTTALHEVLGRHPAVFMAANKEPRHFGAGPEDARAGPRVPHRDVRDVRGYLELFRPGRDRAYRGESSTLYLYSDRAAREIAARCPDARIVIVLREPVERAFSAWAFARMRGLEREADFERAIAQEPDRIARGWGPTWHYQRRGMYAGQVARYLEEFGRERVFVRSYDLLRAAPRRFYEELLTFLGLEWPPGFDVMTDRNRSLVPRLSWLNRVLSLRAAVPSDTRHRIKATRLGRAAAASVRIVNGFNLVRPTPPGPRLARVLQEPFVEDILATEQLTGVALRGWLGRYPEA